MVNKWKIRLALVRLKPTTLSAPGRRYPNRATEPTLYHYCWGTVFFNLPLIISFHVMYVISFQNEPFYIMLRHASTFFPFAWVNIRVHWHSRSVHSHTHVYNKRDKEREINEKNAPRPSQAGIMLELQYGFGLSPQSQRGEAEEIRELRDLSQVRWIGKFFLFFILNYYYCN